MLFILLVALGGYNLQPEPTPPTTLAGTNWDSQFYFYHNNYFFDSDSTGYSEDGQMASSVAIDLESNGLTGEEILYEGKQPFTYTIKDTVLTINYTEWEIEGEKHSRIFYYNFEWGNWVSEYEYTYGHEVLINQPRTETFRLE